MTTPLQVQRLQRELDALAHEDDPPEEAPLPVEGEAGDPEVVLKALYAIATGAGGRATMSERLKASELFLAYRLGKPGQAEAPGGEMSHEERLMLLAPSQPGDPGYQAPSPLPDLLRELAKLDARQRAEPALPNGTSAPESESVSPASEVATMLPMGNTEPLPERKAPDVSWPAYTDPPATQRSGWSDANDFRGLTDRTSWP